ncbi:MAG: NUDIX hydrolase [Planctomycetes bacterium]|nr:NUDIX hydrolase [Planctomycetota bacterium]
MGREPIPTWFFAVVIVRDDRGRFLLVHERKHGQLWFFPAGRVEPGETLQEGALRETLEEAGIHVELTGVYRVEHSPSAPGARVRVIYSARPIDDTPPKSEPDDESLEAAWVTLADLDQLPLRGAEVKRLLTEVAAGAPVYPLSLIAREGMPLH